MIRKRGEIKDSRSNKSNKKAAENKLSVTLCLAEGTIAITRCLKSLLKSSTLYTAHSQNQKYSLETVILRA
jgi:hypothetical protein